MEKEVWKTIPGYPEHEASTHKRIRHGNKILSTYIGTNGYEMVGICYNKKTYNKTVHGLLALTFIPNPNNYPCVGHWDDNRRNNDLSNLYWTTYKENNNHGEHGKKLGRAKGVPVTKLDLYTMDELDFFHNIAEAAGETKTPKCNISWCCRGKRQTAGGYKWEYSRTLF